MTTTTTEEPSVKNIIPYENDEYDDDSSENYNDEWWKRDWDYTSIHIFKKIMTRSCIELVDDKLNLRKVIDIINNVVENITPIMIQEFNKEYIYYYNGDLIDWKTQPLVTTGYIEILKEYLSKLIRVYLDSTFYGNKTILNHIKDTFKKFFSKERDWIDREIDHLEKIIMRL
jgi:hypothetical protein